MLYNTRIHSLAADEIGVNTLHSHSGTHFQIRNYVPRPRTHSCSHTQKADYDRTTNTQIRDRRLGHRVSRAMTPN